MAENKTEDYTYLRGFTPTGDPSQTSVDPSLNTSKLPLDIEQLVKEGYTDKEIADYAVGLSGKDPVEARKILKGNTNISLDDPAINEELLKETVDMRDIPLSQYRAEQSFEGLVQEPGRW